MDPKILAADVANRVLQALREQKLDCVRGGRSDVSQQIHTAVLHTTRDVLEELARSGAGFV